MLRGVPGVEQQTELFQLTVVPNQLELLRLQLLELPGHLGPLLPGLGADSRPELAPFSGEIPRRPPFIVQEASQRPQFHIFPSNFINTASKGLSLLQKFVNPLRLIATFGLGPRRPTLEKSHSRDQLIST